MANKTSVLTYHELRNSGAIGGQGCQQVLKSGGPDKANPFTLNKCIGEMRQQVGDNKPNEKRHNAFVDSHLKKQQKEQIKEIGKTFETRPNFSLKPQFFGTQDGKEALMKLVGDEPQQILDYYDETFKLQDISYYQARTGSQYVTFDFGEYDYQIRFGNHVIDQNVGVVKTSGGDEAGSLVLDDKSNSESYGVTFNMITKRNGMVERDDIVNLINFLKENNWPYADKDLTTQFNEKYVNEKIAKRKEITKNKEQEKKKAHQEQEKERIAKLDAQRQQEKKEYTSNFVKSISKESMSNISFDKLTDEVEIKNKKVNSITLSNAIRGLKDNGTISKTKKRELGKELSEYLQEIWNKGNQ